MVSGLDWLQFTNLDWLSIGVFLLAWMGYTRFAIIRARKQKALSSALHANRKKWMLNAFSSSRSGTPRDVIAIGIFERSVAFFASTSILILAGLLSVLGSSGKVASVLSTLHFVQNDVLTEQIQVKIVLLILLFVYAFFKFCWSMRCYGFLVVMLGSGPLSSNSDKSDEAKLAKERVEWAERSANIMSSAAHHYNLGLRAYYFVLAVLAWFISPQLFILANIVVVSVLYRRDFKSAVLGNL